MRRGGRRSRRTLLSVVEDGDVQDSDVVSFDLMINFAEHVGSVAERCRLRKVCRRSAAGVDIAPRGWVRRQPARVPSEAFSPAELGGGMRGIAKNAASSPGTGSRADGENIMSRACEVDSQARVLRWLTKESGRMPACVDATGCGCNLRRMSRDELRRP
jgi:hypothetical protein